MSTTKRITTLLLALIASAIAATAAEPQTTTLQVAGLKQPAEILVDKWGVPHIYAKDFDDGFFAQGFNAARDRLFQIDLWRRRGLGTLAEVLGAKYVEQDRAARLFLYRGDMEKEWEAYGPDAKRIATAFVAGINSYIDWLGAHPERLPLEFKLLRYAPSKWEVSDVVRIRSHGLIVNLPSEVARAATVCKTDAKNGLKYDEIRKRLEPPWETKVPDGLDPCLPKDVLKTYTLATQNVTITKDALAIRIGFEDKSYEGSNNWTIAPSKSATGRAILANDPHRAYSTPSLRYIVQVSVPGMSIIGAGEPALPGISIGHNGTIAFGLTVFEIDQEDLYSYELNPANAHEYRYKGAWEHMRIVHEMIQVKGGKPVDAELAFTRHGPVIWSDNKRAYAVRSCWLEPGMAPYFGSVWYMRAKNFHDFQRAMLHWGSPSENMVYADSKGDIGWIPGGLAPIRPNWDGLMPVPGDGRYEWAGFWPGDKLPSLHNPASGYVTTSNEMDLPDDYPYKERKLGFEWSGPSRHLRLDEVLKSLPKVSIEDSLKLQNDLTSIPARRLVALLAPLNSNEVKTKAALDLLSSWDGVERADSAQAALMEVWISRHLGRQFLQAMLPENLAETLRSPDMCVMLEALEKPETRFVSDQNGTAAEKRDRLLLASLQSAYIEMEKLQGPDASAWQWGKLLHSLPRHPLFEAANGNLRAKLQPGPFPVGGDPFTPNVAAYRATDFEQLGGPSFRMVVDVGDWDNSRAVNYPGQSGDPNNPHYQDFAQMWRTGEYFPMLYTRSAVEKATELRILLEPVKR
jgi:penicillin amidase